MAAAVDDRIIIEGHHEKYYKDLHKEFLDEAMWLTMSKDGKSFKLPFHRDFLKRYAAYPSSPAYYLSTTEENEIDIGKLGRIGDLDVKIAGRALCKIGSSMYSGELLSTSKFLEVNRARADICMGLGLNEEFFLDFYVLDLIVGSGFSTSDIATLVDGLKWARDGPYRRSCKALDSHIEKNLRKVYKHCWNTGDVSVLDPLSAEMQATIKSEIIKYGRLACKRQKRKLEKIKEIASPKRRRSEAFNEIYELADAGSKVVNAAPAAQN